MSTKHTPEPWMYTGNISHNHVQRTQLVLQAKSVNSKNIAHIIPCAGMTAEEVEANAERIVACVNAMKGKTHPEMWMQEAQIILSKIYEFNHSEIRIGESKIDALLNFAKQRDTLYNMCEQLWQTLAAFNLDPGISSPDLSDLLKENNPSLIKKHS